MIVHVFRSYPAGNARALATYVLDLKHEHAGERLGPYISDPKKHKVEWSRTVNTNADTPAAAISAIEQYNAQNLRWHKVSRMVHLVVSFSEGEKPTREQTDIIEDRLMAAVGFEDHPRISALHRLDDQLVDNWHLHIAVSRIDPVTFKAKHPRHNHFSLQAEAARLEIDLGLRQERKTLLRRERAEIDARRSLDRVVTEHHRSSRGEGAPAPAPFYPDGYLPEHPSVALEREMRRYFDALGRHGALAAEAAGVTREAIMAGLVGIARIRPTGALWEPDTHGTAAFITPVRVHPGNTPHDIESTNPVLAVRKGEIVDLVAWHPSRPDTWVLRTGEAAALGAVQHRLSDEAPEATQVHDTPLAWLRAGGTGIVMLTPDPVERRLILGIADRELAQTQERTTANEGGKAMADAYGRRDEIRHQPPGWSIERRAELGQSGMDHQIDSAMRSEHSERQGRGSQRGTATPAQALEARYKTEKAIALGERKQAEQQVYDRWAGYNQELRGFYNVQHEQQKIALQRGSERHKGHEVLTAGYRGDRMQAQKLRAQALAAARKEHPLPSWDSFLKRESERGDREAGRILRQRQEQQRQHGLER